MNNTLPAGLTTLPGDHTLWERVFTLNPLVVIGTRDCSRVVDLAPSTSRSQ